LKRIKKKYQYPDNSIKTSKYTIYDFFPKSLLFQFKKRANCYFLLVTAFLCIPQVSPLTPVTAIAPLILALMISIIRECIEDYYRHVSDKLENNEKVQKYNGKTFIPDLSSTLEVGNIIKIFEHDVIPADTLLLSCSNVYKVAYIETANLDGEKNLKPKFCVTKIFNIYKDADQAIRIRGTLNCDQPNNDIQKFNGSLLLNKKKNVGFGDGETQVNIKQFLYKGSIIKNTKWVIGVVCYTGKETKIMMNSQNQFSKSSNLEQRVNILIVCIFALQVSLSLVLALIK